MGFTLISGERASVDDYELKNANGKFISMHFNESKLSHERCFQLSVNASGGKLVFFLELYNSG